MSEDKRIKITHPAHAVPFLVKYASKRQEHFVVMTLDGSHAVIRTRTITIGLLNRSLVHPREVFYPAIKDFAAAIIIAHNHPSGSLEPSLEDHSVTKRIKDAGELMGIPLLDHLIISRYGYYSFMEDGAL